MKTKTRRYVPNAVLLVMDSRNGEIPPSMGSERVAVTATCIAVGTASGCDEIVTIELTDERVAAERRLERASESTIQVPSKTVSIVSAHLEEYLSIDMADEKAVVQIWVNHPTEPNEVVVAVFPAGQ